jgi:hypothetical protein
VDFTDLCNRGGKRVFMVELTFLELFDYFLAGDFEVLVMTI